MSKLTLDKVSDRSYLFQIPVFIHSISSWGLFVEFQYEFDNFNALSAKLKYNYKSIEFQDRAPSSAMVVTSVGINNANINSWELPITYRRTLINVKDFRFIVFAGPALCLYGYNTYEVSTTTGPTVGSQDGGWFSLVMDRSFDFY